MGLYERLIKGGETKEETVKAGKRMRDLEEAPLELLCWSCGVGGLSASLWLGAHSTLLVSGRRPHL